MSELYIVGTPIGNLGDISPRALETLKSVDFIAAEDTRVTLKLLNHFGIKKPLISYFQHNMAERSDMIIGRIAAGESCALVSDAGMPAISDPGEILVRLAHDAGITVCVVPGASAAISALCLSGMPSGRFCFEGFLSTNPRTRREHLAELKTEQRTMIFYEAPRKLQKTLKDMLASFGDREITLAREITKLHEETIKTTLSGAAARYETEQPRGEFVLILAGAEPERPDAGLTIDDVAAYARGLMQGGESAANAAKRAVKDTPYSKSDIYKLLVKDR